MSNEVDHDAIVSQTDAALQALKHELRLAQLALEKLRNEQRTEPIVSRAEEPRKVIQQLRILIAAYQKLAGRPPVLVHSQLMSSLLSLHTLQTNASSTIRNIETETALIRDLIKVVDLEKIDLQKAQTMNVYFQDRLNRLGAERQILSDRNPHEVASGIISNLESRLRSSNQDSRLLSGALNEFIKDHLAVLVAAEELGGPIVGASVEVDDDDLDAGYNVRGQARKSTNSQRASVRPGDQRDLETSWGRSTEPSEATGAKARSSTADELRELLETLLNATAQANAGSGSSPYLDIAKESAAIRFLVRVHVAQYHPRDPSRVRLIDFMAMHAD